ncbi:MAG: cysteinyl-tRNA synthetase [Alteromonas naphthalenivorans]|jgi:cysteinyl-tRNA synthetase
MITLSNTLTNKKEQFTPLSPDEVKLYVCGITPYDFAHIGHGRCYVTFDVLYRLLKNAYSKVTYCRNFTDVDDKLMARAEKELGDKLRYHEIAQTFMKAYTQDVAQLNCLPPDIEPLATETIDAIIALVQTLIDKGLAYEVDGDVYYSVRTFKDYGKLSKRKIDDLKSGARVDINDKKKDPLDFALWKAEKENTFWKSPWGYGRPGWHIECSAMAGKHLGKHIDIHAGGMDLIFPHHENEVAQSEGAHGKEFSRYWLHNAFVQLDKEKMSKSLGNFFTLRDVFKQFDPMVIRFYILQHHYRSPLDFSFDDIKASEKAYRKLCKAFASSACPSASLNDEHVQESQIFKKLMRFTQDDLNTVGALGVVFENLSDMQEEQCAIKLFIQNILGLTLKPLPEVAIKITPEIQELIDAREQARIDKDWAKADELRDKLTKLGVEVQDKKL